MAADCKGDEGPYLDPPALLEAVPKVPLRIAAALSAPDAGFRGGRGGGRKLNLLNTWTASGLNTHTEVVHLDMRYLAAQLGEEHLGVIRGDQHALH